MTAAGVNYSYLTDAQGSVRAVVDVTGGAQWTCSSELFEPRNLVWLSTGKRQRTRDNIGAL